MRRIFFILLVLCLPFYLSAQIIDTLSGGWNSKDGETSKIVHRNFHNYATNFETVFTLTNSRGLDEERYYFPEDFEGGYDSVYLKSELYGDTFFLQKVAHFEDRKGNASFQYFFPNGQLEKTVQFKSKGEFETQIRISRTRNENDELVEKPDTNYTWRGLADGLVKVFYHNGNLKEEKSFNKGMRNGIYQEYYFYGQKQTEGAYLDDCPIGDWKIWYSNGQLYESESFSDCLLNGESLRWYDNGQPLEKKEFRYGNPTGEAKIFYKNGQLKAIQNFLLQEDSLSLQELTQLELETIDGIDFSGWSWSSQGLWYLESKDTFKRAQQNALIRKYNSVLHGNMIAYFEDGTQILRDSFEFGESVDRFSIMPEEKLKEALNPQKFNNCRWHLDLRLPFYITKGIEREICFYGFQEEFRDTNEFEVLPPLQDSILTLKEIIHVKNKLGKAHYQLFYPSEQQFLDLSISENSRFLDVKEGWYSSSTATLSDWSKCWYPNGQLKWKKHYLEDSGVVQSDTDSAYFYFPNGQLKRMVTGGDERYRYHGDEGTRIEKEWYSNGELKLELIYAEKGLFSKKIYFENGQLREMMNKLDFEKHGWQEKYDKAGNILLKRLFKKGKLKKIIK